MNIQSSLPITKILAASCFVFWAVLLTTDFAYAQQEIDRYLLRMMEENHIPGLQAAITKDGEPTISSKGDTTFELIFEKAATNDSNGSTACNKQKMGAMV